MSKAIMFQGTGSDVGKSVLVAGFCRALKHRGLTVRPFKPQNMSNNAAVTADGGEIGRAQALQALACGIEPSVHMNPVLLKPQSDRNAQIIVQGKVRGTTDANWFQHHKSDLMVHIINSFNSLKQEADIVVVEGAGSPAEVNLRAGDIANMGFALASSTPVILIGDIDRGGVIASLVGSHMLLKKAEQNLVRGFIINKFRGDMSLFDEGLTVISDHTEWPSCGVLPFVPAVKRLPAEDAVTLGRPDKAHSSKIVIAVPMLSRIANFDDVDPLKLEEDVDLRFIPPGTPLPAEAQLILIPGTKATLADMDFFRAQGWDIDLAAHVRRGGYVLGICGGFQMLGKTVSDPEGIEGIPGIHDGLGHLDITTIMQTTKTVRQITAYSPFLDCSARGYEIHAGETTGPQMNQPFLTCDGRPVGAMSENGQIMGSYLHGLFTDDNFRAHFLSLLRSGNVVQSNFSQQIEDAIDILADQMEKHLDIDFLLQTAV